MLHQSVHELISTTPTRKIIHVDMDAFYASVEVLDRPELAGLPLVVGGSPDSRSVVCTASYEARKYGIRSAMPCSVAARLCPQAVFLRPRFERYKEISQAIRGIFARYTSLIEPLSLDEAYLDVTNNREGLFATQIAKRIKDAIANELHLSASAGVAPNKLVAKIASDWRKPSGLTVVQPHEVADFMRDLPVRKIHGVGPATEKRLAEFGVYRCADIRKFGQQQMVERFGSWGDWLWDASHGHDERSVKTTWERKSYGREDTFDRDITDVEELERRLRDLAQAVSASLVKRSIKARTITLKLKYHNFESITRSRSLSEPVAITDTIYDTARELLRQKTEAGRRPARLIGVSVSNLTK